MTTNDRTAVITGLASLAEHLSTDPRLELPYGFEGAGLTVYVYDDESYLAWHHLLGHPEVQEEAGTAGPFRRYFRGAIDGLKLRIAINVEKVGDQRVIGMVEQTAWSPPLTDEQAAREVNAGHALPLDCQAGEVHTDWTAANACTAGHTVHPTAAAVPA